MWVSSVLSATRVTSHVDDGLLEGTFVVTDDDSGVEGFSTGHLESVSVEVEVGEWDTPVVEVVEETDTVNSVVGGDNDFIDEGTDVLWVVIGAQAEGWGWGILGDGPGEYFLAVLFTVVAVAQDDEPTHSSNFLASNFSWAEINNILIEFLPSQHHNFTLFLNVIEVYFHYYNIGIGTDGDIIEG